MIKILMFPFSSFDQVIKVVNVGQMMLTVMIVKGLDGDELSEAVFGIG